ncbi:DUF4405 domain-containing protein [Sulfurovum sp. ST-21]|uniref:DUF4405 domain-containing protein n=1 Tax=Sulfurovum indicum TaxID=2779528 RepID=A0A7M1S3Y1_9BACT|nr:DUF4405 domain-containing protein [Sulfurovum indicum]QOR61060.1 DUF4405 domain-containing protein [Sulfurovum indicum]
MRKITSLTLALSFLLMTYTGIMLFLCPHGRVAYWWDWHFLGLTKSQYGDLHTTSMIVFILFGILHIYYNWKPIVSYLKDRRKKLSFTKKEFLIALGINMVFVIGTLVLVQPFKSFLDFEEAIKESWTKSYGEPPYGHAEETKLNIFCRKMNIDIDQAKEILHKHKIDFKESESLKTIARRNSMAPSMIYELIRPSAMGSVDNVPARLGRKTLQELGNMNKIDLKEAIERLEEKGVEDVSEKSRIKNLADELDMTPLELYQFLREEK